MSRVNWSLFHITTKTQIDNLSQSQVGQVIVTMADPKQWRIWRQGTPSWENVDRFEELCEKPAVDDARVAKRYSRKLKVYVDYGGHIYTADTIDISATGIAIQPPLQVRPEGHFEMKVQDPESQEFVQVICKVVESADTANRFEITKVPDLTALESLLHDES